MAWIAELGRDLTGRVLDIWTGSSGLPAATEEAYRGLLRREAARVRRGRCVSLGPDSGRRVPCAACDGAVRFKLFVCRHPAVPGGECTLEFVSGDIPDCPGCVHHEAAGV